MAQPTFDPLFEPENVLLVRDSDRRGEPTQEGVVAGDDPVNGCRYPGVETTAVDPESLQSLDVTQEGSLGILDVTPADLQPVLVDVADAGVETVCIRTRVETSGMLTDLAETIDELDLRILGPGASVRMGPKAAREAADSLANGGSAKATGTAIVSDDPEIAQALAQRAAAEGIEVGPVTGIGAGIDVGIADVVPRLAAMDDVDLVLGRFEVVTAAFARQLRGIDTETPVAIHSGTGPDFAPGATDPIPGGRINAAILEQAGACHVPTLDRMLEGAPALAGQPPPDPSSVVVVSNAGGPGVMAIDAVGRSNMTVAELAAETRSTLEQVIPDHGSTRNPLDLLADSDIEVFETVLDAVLADPGVGAAVVISAPSALFSFADLAEIIAEARRDSEKPLVTALMGGDRTKTAAEILERVGVPNYFDPYRAIDALELLATHGSVIEHRMRVSERPTSFSRRSVESAIGGVERSTGPGQKRLQGPRAREFLREIGVETLADDETSGVELGVWAGEETSRGRLVAVGMSDFVAAVGDVSVRAVPLSRADADSMLDGLRAAPILEGARGGQAVDTEAISATLRGVSTLLDSIPEVNRIAIPNLVATPDGVRAAGIEVTTHQGDDDRIPRG